MSAHPRIRMARCRLERLDEIGRGGEAIVYRFRRGVAKVFHAPDDPTLAHDPELQRAATARLETMEEKIRAFPKELPDAVVAPCAMIEDPNRSVIGYTMPLVRGESLAAYARPSSTLAPPATAALLTQLYDVTAALHARGVTIGDFNPENILVERRWFRAPRIRLIDADAMQFATFPCRTFTPQCAAPEILHVERRDDGKPTFTMVAPHSSLTDWYAFLVIAMRLLTFTDPFGGVVDGMDDAARIAERVTIFDRRVRRPLTARPLRDVPRPMLDAFLRTFHLGERFIPDRTLLASISSRAA